MDQLTLFDLDEVARDAVSVTPWHRAPLGFTTNYYTSDKLAAAGERWIAEHGAVGAWRASHMWHPAWSPQTVTEEHRLDVTTADLRCGHTTRCSDVGDLLYQASCDRCRWHQITASENDAVEAWHDHALPGWRDLPVLPTKISVNNATAVTRWIEQHYPATWHGRGVPIRTQRGQHAGRHVPGRSPLGGYDLASHDE